MIIKFQNLENQANQNEAMEVTTFKLNGATCKDFIEANKDIDAFLQRQSGFRSRRIAEIGKGVIADVLIWDTVEDGTQAMHRLMDEMADSPVHGLINMQTVSWNIGKVEHSLES